MQSFFPPAPLFAAFLAASLVFTVFPGPAVFYIVTRGATQGRGAALASVAGVALGNLGNAVAASLGLAALFAISSIAFTVVKYAGAAYLIYLGVRALRTRSQPGPDAGARPPAARLRPIFTDGFVVALFNPKTTLFFAAFLPQFLPASATPAQTIAMGAITVLIGATTDSCYALASGAVKPWLARGGAGSLGRYVRGGAFIGLGLLTALTSRGTKT